MHRRLCRLAFCIAGMVVAGLPSLSGQESTQPDPPPASSSGSVAPKIEEKPIAVTPLDEAEALFRAGKFNEAIARYNTIIASRTDNAIAYAGLARTYLKVRKPNDAYLAATKATERDPSLGIAHAALGEVYFRQGKLDDAQTEYLKALKLGQVDGRTYLGLSRLYKATYDFRKAKVAIDKAHILDATDPDVGDAWIETRPLTEQVKALEDKIALRSNYYSRAERAGFKQRLTLTRDEIEHPERTCSISNRPDSVEAPLTPIGPKKDLVGLNVSVNGMPSRLVLSTVSSGIVISSEIAEAAGVQTIARADMDALGEQNPPEAHIGLVRSLKVQDLEFENCYVTVVEKVSPGSFYDQFEGLIAAGLFSAYVVGVDIPHARVSLQPLPPRPASEERDKAKTDSGDADANNFHDRYTPPDMARWMQMYRVGSSILIPARVNNSPPALFEVAASSKYNVLSPDFARERASLKPVESSARLEGINGKVSSESIGKVKLAFADQHFKTVRMISFDDSRSIDSAETEIAGYLGYDLLRNLQFTINYRDGLIHFTFDPEALVNH